MADLPCRHNSNTGLFDIDAEVKRILTESATRTGLDMSAIRRRMGLPAKDSWKVERAIQRLLDMGEIQRRKHHGHAILYFAEGANLLPPGEGTQLGDFRVEYAETPDMAAKLEKLFRAAACDYSHGNIITLERGRVGLKPSIPIPGRAIGGW